ncbi:uncharacterized protein METZ01_LOCUS269516, partial [marine metagenome]
RGEHRTHNPKVEGSNPSPHQSLPVNSHQS